MPLRTLIIGDVHGCLDELNQLLRVVQYDPTRDRPVFLGDLMDRGPDPVGVVHRVRELGAECVLGNHDEKHLRWARHEAKRRADAAYQNPMRPFSEEKQRQHEALSAEDLAFLASLPLYLHLDERWLVVHAGLVAGTPIAEQKPASLVRLRYLNADGKFLSYDPAVPLPPDTRFWTTHWQGPENVVYGHMVHGLAEPRIDEPAPGIRCYGIDTGCCFGGRLTALILPDCNIVQVEAKRAYAPFTHAEE
jgi:diadenosine tetraphosphatase ApaH/serine/threonine PP2A family protein phosphatase